MSYSSCRWSWFIPRGLESRGSGHWCYARTSFKGRASSRRPLALHWSGKAYLSSYCMWLYLSSSPATVTLPLPRIAAGTSNLALCTTLVPIWKQEVELGPKLQRIIWHPWAFHCNHWIAAGCKAAAWHDRRSSVWVWHWGSVVRAWRSWWWPASIFLLHFPRESEEGLLDWARYRSTSEW
jgi:hypothetical protein